MSNALAWEPEGDAWSSHGIKKGDPDTLVAQDARAEYQITPYGVLDAGLTFRTRYSVWAEGEGQTWEADFGNLEDAKAFAEKIHETAL